MTLLRRLLRLAGFLAMLILKGPQLPNQVLQLLCLLRLQPSLLVRYLPQLVDQVPPLVLHPLHDLLPHRKLLALLHRGLLLAAAEVRARNIEL